MKLQKTRSRVFNQYSSEISNEPMTPYTKQITPILQPAEIIERMCRAVDSKASSQYKAFYSSEIGGIIIEPAFMMVHMDDHMVHRGHSVFDVSRIEHGHIYLLERHLERFLISASEAHIPVTYSKNIIRKIILETCTASLIKNGEVRFWLSAGRGSFGLTTQECNSSAFYVQVIERKIEIPNFTERWRIVSSTVNAKSEPFSTIISTNYLSNAICLKEAETLNAHEGILIDANGYVVGGSTMNFLIYTGDKRLLVPAHDKYMVGCTVKRIIELVNKLLDNETPENREEYEWLYKNINSAELVPPLQQQEILSLAKELFLMNSSIIIVPIHQWDNEWVGDQFAYGKSEMFRVLYTMLRQDMIYPGYDSSLLTPFLT